MTPDETNKLNDLQNKYDTALANYTQEQSDNYNWHQGWITAGNTPGGIYGGHDNNYWTAGKNGSDQSLVTKKSILDSSKANLDAYKAQLSAQAAADFAAANPTQYAAIQAAQAKATSDAAAAKSSADAAAQTAIASKGFIAQNVKYFIIGGVIIAVSLVAYFIIKIRIAKKKKQATT